MRFINKEKPTSEDATTGAPVVSTSSDAGYSKPSDDTEPPSDKAKTYKPTRSGKSEKKS